jgi:hypothetical protein
VACLSVRPVPAPTNFNRRCEFQRFNPIFVFPVPEHDSAPPASTPVSEIISHTPGRRTGTGSANISVATRVATSRASVVGFRQVSLLSALQLTGHAPTRGVTASGPLQSFEDLRKAAGRPLVVLPECTTSNGRGLLRFANLFQEKVPVRGYAVFVMCVRYVLDKYNTRYLALTGI